MKILYICTHNRCRSILAEAVTNHYGKGLVTAASAGSEPAGVIHPMTLKALKRHRIPVKGLHSKSWDDMEVFEPDYVITMCDKAAREQCPLWFGKSLRVHWGMADPSAVKGGEARVMAAMDAAIIELSIRIDRLVEVLETNPGRTRVMRTLERLDRQDPVLLEK